MRAPLYSLSLSCPEGVELLLAEEASALGLENAKAGNAVVTGLASLASAYQLCLYSRLANRVLLQLARFQAANSDAMCQALLQFDFGAHLDSQHSFFIRFTGRGAGIDNSHYGAQRVKDAVVDWFTSRHLPRPRVAKDADIIFAVHVYRDQVTLSLDLSGQSLHRRGYRQQQGQAPLKENLAAAILLRANWPALAAQGYALVDPMCGSGTLVIEAALMAYDIAPNLLRSRWGFSHWRQHDPALFAQILEKAHARAQLGKNRPKLWLRGYEADPRLIAPARHNIERAGLQNHINIYQGDLQTFAPRPDHHQAGLVVVNPPYGVRLGEVHELQFLYQHLGERLRQVCLGWQAAVFTGNVELCKKMGLRSHKQYAFKNGAIDCKLVLLDINERMFVNERQAPDALLAKSARQEDGELSQGAVMFANRLKKNQQKLRRFLAKEEISAYRLYDADMPEYAVAIDIYADFAHVQEYAAPKTVAADKAEARLLEVLAAIKATLPIPTDHIILKRRAKQSGSAQYQKLANERDFISVNEYGVKLLVNLHNYLDTGLFLDHRPMRRLIAQQARGKRLLNLYCYTASVSTHAAKAGAFSTTNVDLSNTYLNWARKNFAANGIAGKHEFIKADAMAWLATYRQQADAPKFDIIFIDPPTFSNSKNLEQDFDVQRDHFELIEAAMALLARDGVLYFSNNYRRFVLDARLEFAYQTQNISAQSLDPDFARNSKIHQAWQIGFLPQ